MKIRNLIFLLLPGLLPSGLRAFTLPMEPAPYSEPAAWTESNSQAETRFREAENAYQGLRPDARFRLQEFIQDYPASLHEPYARLYLGDLNFFDGDYAAALNIYKGLKPSWFGGETGKRLTYRTALCMIKRGFFERARPLLKSLEADPNYRDAAIFYDAYIDYIGGDYDAAYPKFQSVKSGERGLEAEYYINQIDYRRGDYQKVIANSRRLLGKNPPSELMAETERVAGMSMYKTGDVNGAFPVLEKYLRDTGEEAEPSAVYALGTIYYDRGRHEEAARLFSSLTDSNDALAQSSWLYIGQIFMEEGNSGAAALAFDKAARMNWDANVAETAAYNLAVTAASGENLPFADATEIMDSFILNYPASQYSGDVALYLAKAYYNQREYEEALERLDMIKNPSEEVKRLRQQTLCNLGIAQYREGKAAKAVATLREAASYGALNPDVTAKANLWLGEAEYSLKKYREAAGYYRSAIDSGRLGANEALAAYNLGYCFMKLKDYRKARLAFEDALSHNTLNRQQTTDATLRIADSEYYLGDYAPAMKNYRSVAIGGGAEGAYARIREADILGREGKIGEKIDILRQVASSEYAGPWRKVALTRLGDAYSERGDDRLAAETYALLMEGGMTPEEYNQALHSLATNADNLMQKGETEAALAAYRRLEASGDKEFYAPAVIGIMRASSSPDEIIEYSGKVMALPGIPADIADEAIYLNAKTVIDNYPDRAPGMINPLYNLASSADRDWGAKAAVTLGEYYLAAGEPETAERLLLDMIEAGSDDPYWLAKGYILLSDAYMALDKDYLARLYLETLRDNYPGSERDVFDSIDNRLKRIER